MNELDKIVIVKEGHRYTTYINDVHCGWRDLEDTLEVFFRLRHRGKNNEVCPKNHRKMGELNNLYEFRIKNDEGEILKMTFLTENIRQAIGLYYICGNTMPFTVIRRVKK